MEQTKPGRRYDLKTKHSVVGFVAKYNPDHGRGGITAATKRFGISPLTIASWRKSLAWVGTPQVLLCKIEPKGDRPKFLRGIETDEKSPWVAGNPADCNEHC